MFVEGVHSLIFLKQILASHVCVRHDHWSLTRPQTPGTSWVIFCHITLKWEICSRGTIDTIAINKRTQVKDLKPGSVVPENVLTFVWSKLPVPRPGVAFSVSRHLTNSLASMDARRKTPLQQNCLLGGCLETVPHLLVWTKFWPLLL